MPSVNVLIKGFSGATLGGTDGVKSVIFWKDTVSKVAFKDKFLTLAKASKISGHSARIQKVWFSYQKFLPISIC